MAGRIRAALPGTTTAVAGAVGVSAAAARKGLANLAYQGHVVRDDSRDPPVWMLAGARVAAEAAGSE